LIAGGDHTSLIYASGSHLLLSSSAGSWVVTSGAFAATNRILVGTSDPGVFGSAYQFLIDSRELNTTPRMVCIAGSSSLDMGHIEGRDETGSRHWLVNLGDRSQNNNFQIWSDTASVYVLSVTSTKRVGIGNNIDSPQSTLDVDGNLTVGDTYAENNAAPTDGMIVEGNVGIGTNSPNERMEISQGGNYQLRLDNPDTGGGYWNIAQTDNAFAAGGGKLVFVPDSTTSTNAVFVIENSSGDVGIGVLAPAAKLEIESSTYPVSRTTRTSTQTTARRAVTAIQHKTSNNMGDGFGAVIAFEASDSGVSNYTLGQISSTRKNGSDTSSDIIFTVKDAGVTDDAVVIDYNSNVGIGDTSPIARLHVSNGDSGITSLALGSDELLVENSGDAGLTIATPNTSVGRISFGDPDNNNPGRIAYDHSIDDMYLYSGDSIRVTIEGNTGDVGIGTTSPAQRLDVEDDTSGGYTARFQNDGNNADRYGIGIAAGLDVPSVTGDIRWIALEDGNGTDQSYVQFLSTSPNAQFAAASDERLKKNISPTKVDGLDIIRKLELVEFEWKDSKRGKKQEIGYIGQQVREVYPPMVSKAWSKDIEDEILLVGDSCLVSVLVRAVQQQQEKIEEMEKKIKEIKDANIIK